MHPKQPVKVRCHKLRHYLNILTDKLLPPMLKELQHSHWSVPSFLSIKNRVYSWTRPPCPPQCRPFQEANAIPGVGRGVAVDTRDGGELQAMYGSGDELVHIS